ncbi:MAG: hypothetical protein MUE52_08650 [Tabrizicola sp.]|jgi:hypothetical protein|nr:hypothetical protein [Tabrizicola sp.]
MQRIDNDYGRLNLTSEFMARDSAAPRALATTGRKGSGKEFRFQPVEDLVVALDSMVAAAVAA